jgi:hypothetical protein
MAQVNESVEINAALPQVWQALLDFERYPDWNPFIIQMNGRAEVGATLEEWVLISKEKRVRFKTKILALEPAKQLVWRGIYGAGWLLNGVHQFILEPLSNGSDGQNRQRTRLTQKETFSGLLLPLMNMEQSRQGYRAMNEALKQWVETTCASTLP